MTDLSRRRPNSDHFTSGQALSGGYACTCGLRFETRGKLRYHIKKARSVGA